ncbi:hypothetical protein MKW98_006551 [Papaver atlanticum]|uniref:Replication factor C subunit 1 n=1 Tax=Papaver atlanticum TaxID=357466 RepID=A0AAD4XTT7_9MAGN|nr:hypothetical protein MKW98_006551 [Papaver atlanticum]
MAERAVDTHAIGDLVHGSQRKAAKTGDIREWLMKAHGRNDATKPAAKPAAIVLPPVKPAAIIPQIEKPITGGQESSGRKKTSRYLATKADKTKDEQEVEKTVAKRKPQESSKALDDDVEPPPVKKLHKAKEEKNDDSKPPPMKKLLKAKKEEDDDDVFQPSPAQKLKSVPRKGVEKSVEIDENDEDDDEVGCTPRKPAGRGGGGRSSAASPAGGRGGFMTFSERRDPPHKGEKEVPEGAPDCLVGKTFVISGTLDSLEREEAEDLIKRHGGQVTGSVSKKTSYLLADEDIGGRKSEKAKELGTAFLTEDGLFDPIHKSKPTKSPPQDLKNTKDKGATSQPKGSPLKVVKGNEVSFSLEKKTPPKGLAQGVAPAKRKTQAGGDSSLTWPEKYKPKTPNDILGNQFLVKQLHEWLSHWNDHFLHTGQQGKGKKQDDSGAKKAVLISGSPGIGKSTSAKLVSQMLGQNNKRLFIMDEVDGMYSGDRGGVADLIASIKISKIPIICICNDRHSQKLKSLLNYCLLLDCRKPTKQQMAKRLMQVATAEGVKVNEIALEGLAERFNGDMRMSLNQLQYMSLSMSVFQYDDVRQHLLSSAKDEDTSLFTAVAKLFDFNGGKLRMDERVDLCMSDADLVPLLIQENYLNLRPSAVGKDEDGTKRMNMIARAAESIGNGDIVNVQIRRYQQWQHFQTSLLASSIILAALLHGRREILEQGERNVNRFGGWLGKNLTTGKNMRLLEDVHVHLLASRESISHRETLRVDYFPLIRKHLTDPLRSLPKDEAVQKVVEFMDAYSISQEDYDSIMELSQFKKHPNPQKAYKQGSSSRIIRSADLIMLPGTKKVPKKRIAAMLEPVYSGGLIEENGDMLGESEEENASDAEDTDGPDNGEKKLQMDLQSNSKKGIQVQLDLKNNGKSSAKKAPASKSRVASTKKGSRNSGGSAAAASASKKKR